MSMDIAIIGNTETALHFASGLSDAGHSVYCASTVGFTANEQIALTSRNNVHCCTINEAAANSDLVIIATRADEVRQVAYYLGDVRRKVIIDTTANIEYDSPVTVKTMNAIASITGSQHIVKVFYTKGYETAIKPLFNGITMDLIYLTESKKAAEIIRIMSNDIGLKLLHPFGTIENLPLFDELTNCLRRLQSKPSQTSDTSQLEDVQE